MKLKKSQRRAAKDLLVKARKANDPAMIQRALNTLTGK